MIYLDHAATTPASPEVVEAMQPWLAEYFGNPSAVYGAAAQSRRMIAAARRSCGALIGASPREICFTSGGTEADNQAIVGAVLLGRERLLKEKENSGGEKEAVPHMITSRIEHPAVLNTCRFMERMGCRVTYLDVDENGLVRPGDVEAAIEPDTCLISIMTANNELGTIEPVCEIGQTAHRHGILFHTDAVQAYGHIPLNVQELQADLLSASAHKLNGPKGIGLLYIRAGLQLPKLLNGGGQERGRRAGTENTAGIAGFGKAAELAGRDLAVKAEKTTALRNYMEETLLEKVPDLRINAAGADRLPGTLHVSIPGISAETMLILLDRAGICASAGSACSSGAVEPSHVLRAAGLPESCLRSSLRFSLGAENTREEIDYTVKILEEHIRRLRADQ